ncbi:hypothetical protein F5Y00DRAFT_262659 [Daldinia vernicosa]|uniref:uncharacterized protein n=1 Tax=Daldinia vernicosa TaxID=114800 RepID=UPI002008AE0D|nr:uncharacterized protein F5Y00DRAFT_262659 [Daldinia vernicosa]KAI0848273.1 hypothetical protein F5Y00DRAFT_262659 [Daldinia vernicosa]
MKADGVVALALASVVHAHCTFPTSSFYVRKTTNFGVHDHGPLFNVSSTDLRYFELEPGKGSPETMSVKAGNTVGFGADGNVTHPGPLQFYMAKVPEGETAKAFVGDGDVWFKIFNDDPEFGGSWPEWPNWSRVLPLFLAKRNSPG